MSAPLSGQQFMSVKRIGKLVSGTYPGVRMRQLTRKLIGPPHDLDSQNRVLQSQEHLNADIGQHGIRHPIGLSWKPEDNGDPDAKSVPTVDDGQHRYLAARHNGLTQMPVKYNVLGGMPVEEFRSRAAEFAGGYTRPEDRPARTRRKPTFDFTR